ncbi:MAG: DNA translocase FtsK [Patescibacteria group bacterium]|nr:DNA translocase FtsK [Patescibacteria group bacterium]
MAKKKKADRDGGVWKSLKEETANAIMAILSFVIALVSLLAAFGKAGPVGDYGYEWLMRIFGIGYFLIPVVFSMLGIAFLQGVERRFNKVKAAGAVLFFLSGLGLLDLVPGDRIGGVAGAWVAGPLIRIVDVWATGLSLGALFVISLIVVFEWHITWASLNGWRERKEAAVKGKTAEMDDKEQAAVAEALAAVEDEAVGEKAAGAREAEAAAVAARLAESKKPKKRGILDFTEKEESDFAAVSAAVPAMTPFVPPPLSLLEKDRGRAETGDIKANANIIKRTLQNFGITVEMDEISIGPSVTRYALKPAEGVKLSRIVGLNNDLALALAAHPIRIEAPIPGKSLVGIEVPNTAKTTVGLATLLAGAEFQESTKPLLMSLGKDITGKGHFSNLAKAPHMLIAGATGSGKSVTIHALITSLLYRNSPESLKFIMIDPKRVELTLYNKIPHLLTPVITDPKKAILALKWAAKEMSRRYDILEQNAARDIESYHKNVLAPELEKRSKGAGDAAAPLETMPYIVVIIDELADIMQTYPRELESAIVRLAQMSRAVGIHLVISTQRPSVNVITGLIKANIPTRVALQVASQIDSRTILDQSGAEKLLGAGDMLYLGGEMSKPVRLQSAFITESEVKKVVSFLADRYKDEIMGEISLGVPEAGSSAAFDSMMDSDSLDDDDEMYEPAREAVVAAGKASTSYIQRKLGIGYSRAAKLMDMLEEHGVIGPANGSKPREVIGVGTGIEQQESAEAPASAAE